VACLAEANVQREVWDPAGIPWIHAGIPNAEINDLASYLLDSCGLLLIEISNISQIARPAAVQVDAPSWIEHASDRDLDGS
jgi:hypothetical protein